MYTPKIIKMIDSSLEATPISFPTRLKNRDFLIVLTAQGHVWWWKTSLNGLEMGSLENRLSEMPLKAACLTLAPFSDNDHDIYTFTTSISNDPISSIQVSRLQLNSTGSSAEAQTERIEVQGSITHLCAQSTQHVTYVLVSTENATPEGETTSLFLYVTIFGGTTWNLNWSHLIPGQVTSLKVCQGHLNQALVCTNREVYHITDIVSSEPVVTLLLDGKRAGIVPLYDAALSPNSTHVAVSGNSEMLQLVRTKGNQIDPSWTPVSVAARVCPALLMHRDSNDLFPMIKDFVDAQVQESLDPKNAPSLESEKVDENVELETPGGVLERIVFQIYSFLSQKNILVGASATEKQLHGNRNINESPLLLRILHFHLRLARAFKQAGLYSAISSIFHLSSANAIFQRSIDINSVHETGNTTVKDQKEHVQLRARIPPDVLIPLVAITTWILDWSSRSVRQLHFALSDSVSSVRPSPASLFLIPGSLTQIHFLHALVPILRRTLDDQGHASTMDAVKVLLNRTKLASDVFAEFIRSIRNTVANDADSVHEMRILSSFKIPKPGHAPTSPEPATIKILEACKQKLDSTFDSLVTRPMYALTNDAWWLGVDSIPASEISFFFEGFLHDTSLDTMRLRQEKAGNILRHRSLKALRHSIDAIRKIKLSRAKTFALCVNCQSSTAIETYLEKNSEDELFHAPWTIGFAFTCVCGGKWWKIKDHDLAPVPASESSLESNQPVYL
jgi:hypothetical protein